MSEGGEGRPKTDIKENNPKKEEVKLQETTGTPEKKLPLSKKLGAAIKYISSTVGEGKSQEVDDEVTYISQEGVKPKTLKEHLEKEREPKEFRFQLSGSKIPVEMLRAKELPEEMVLNVVLTGGAQAGIGNAEAVIRMMEMGLFDKKSLKVNFWGISAGAANAAYAATGVDKAKEAVKMYTQENLGYTLDENGKRIDTGGKLVHLPDGKAAQLKALFEASPGNPLVDTEYVADNIASGKRKLDVEALKASKYGVFARLMNEDGGQEWVDLKQEKDPANTLRAAINVPAVSRKAFIEREGKKYADGAFAEGALLDEIFKREGDDAKVLIISNGSFGKGGQMEIVQKILGMKAKKEGEDAYGYNEKVAKLIATHNSEAKIQGKEVWDEIVAGKNIVLMELTRDSDFIPELEKDPEKLKKAGEKFAEFVGNTFDLAKELPLKVPGGLMSAEGELKAMDAGGKPAEANPERTTTPVIEASSDKLSTGFTKVEVKELDDETRKEIKKRLFVDGEFILTADSTDNGGVKWKQYVELGDPQGYDEQMKNMNDQLTKYVPENFHGRVPIYMFRVEKDGVLKYDPNYEPSLKEKILGRVVHLGKEPADKATIKELRDYYLKVKMEEKNGLTRD